MSIQYPKVTFLSHQINKLTYNFCPFSPHLVILSCVNSLDTVKNLSTWRYLGIFTQVQNELVGQNTVSISLWLVDLTSRQHVIPYSKHLLPMMQSNVSNCKLLMF